MTKKLEELLKLPESKEIIGQDSKKNKKQKSIPVQSHTL